MVKNFIKKQRTTNKQRAEKSMIIRIKKNIKLFAVQ